jgi:glycosyltransferase involved in cell wall biosynthesis
MFNMILPKISCICPTFSRAYLLEEAIESFHKQDYQGEKELIVCNDFPLQEFVYEHPEVKIINLPERCPNLGSKRNTAYSYATGEYMITWGDDDIHLPRRISRMVNVALELNTEFLFEGPYIILYGGKISYQPGLVAGPNMISKRLFEAVGGIPNINSGEDQAFNANLRKYLNKPKLDVCIDPDAQFFYRFTSPRPHISQYGFDKADKKSGYQIMLEEAEKLIESGKEPKGRYELQPHWKKDWVEEVRNAIAK